MGVLEQLFPGAWGEDNQDKTRRNFARLDRLFALVSKSSDGFGFTVAGIGVRFGIQSLTWPGATNQQAFTISHGLGHAPVVVLAVNSNNNTAGLPRTFTYTATQFTLNIIAPAAVAVGTGDTYRWVAIG